MTDNVEGGASGRSFRKYRWPVLGLLLLVGAAIAGVIVLTSGNSPSTSPARGFAAAANAVPMNHVTGSGSATIQLRGDVATVTVNTYGLLDNHPHFIHIHATGLGLCPPARAAQLHNGFRTISTSNGRNWYGTPQMALTTVGSTSPTPSNVIAAARYPTSTHGRIRYTRTVTLGPAVAAQIRDNNAVIVVHGIDYNNNKRYDFSLGPSDLGPRLSMEETSPALCGPLRPQAVAATNRQGSPVTVYTASLRIDGAAVIDQIGNRLLLYCHIAGLAVPTTESRKSAGSVGASAA